ncbi:Glycerophosphocholine phosphodiesterase [Dinochytrium kinnereticum]|nr:Glycerophosphocholine phosphodiesterase [Dinochytrium kinnereticum]
MLLLTLGTKDLRLNPERPPVQFNGAADPSSLTLALKIALAGDGSVSKPTEVPIPHRSSMAGEELIFYFKDMKRTSISIKILDSETGSVIASGSTGPLDSARPRSLWGERNPLGGRVLVPFVSLVTGDVIATMTIEYTVITFFDHKNAFEAMAEKDWSETKLVGHRGLGMNRPLVDGKGFLQLGENTIGSFFAAGQNGAEYVEFDAQLTRDHTVVLYHDFHMDETGFNISISDIFLEQFLHVKPADGVSARSRFHQPKPIKRVKSSGDLPAIGVGLDQKSGPPNKWPWKGNHDGSIQEKFTTLRNALLEVPMSIGFNIEIKYPLDFEAEEDRLDVAECNLFVDEILKEVFDHAKERKIIFSSFHAEAARMARLKQSRYPVYFLTMGGTHKTPDSRCNSLYDAARFAASTGMQGVVTDATPLVKFPELVKKVKSYQGEGAVKGLRLFTYGSLNNVPGNAKLLQNAGLDGIIADRVRQVSLELKK